MPEEYIGKTGKGCGYTKSQPRAWTADELPFGKNTIVLTFTADGKERRDYIANVPADRIDMLDKCIGKQPTEVFVKLWQLDH